MHSLLRPIFTTNIRLQTHVLRGKSYYRAKDSSTITVNDLSVTLIQDNFYFRNCSYCRAIVQKVATTTSTGIEIIDIVEKMSIQNILNSNHKVILKAFIFHFCNAIFLYFLKWFTQDSIGEDHISAFTQVSIISSIVAFLYSHIVYFEMKTFNYRLKHKQIKHVNRVLFIYILLHVLCTIIYISIYFILMWTGQVRTSLLKLGRFQELHGENYMGLPYILSQQ